MSKDDKIKQFNPSSAGLNNGKFIGLPFDEHEAEIVLLPVPWDVTVSYTEGTSTGPLNILEASRQLDLFDPNVKDAWKMGLFMRSLSTELQKKNLTLRKDASHYQKYIENVGQAQDSPIMKEILERVNSGCLEMVQWVKEECLELLTAGKIIGLVGGDHSSPLGFIQALGERYSQFSILQIDAHMDLRKGYEGFTYSHASIFYNALHVPSVKQLVQIGVRDYCEEEVRFAEEHTNKITTFFDHQIKELQFQGHSFQQICQQILDGLHENVYISFDIDGLQPHLCPNTGTPVPGGLQFEEAIFLIQQLVEKGHKIIGFDLCEVAGKPHEWDGNVGARILYKLANMAGKSQFRI